MNRCIIYIYASDAVSSSCVAAPPVALYVSVAVSLSGVAVPLVALYVRAQYLPLVLLLRRLHCV